MSQILIQKQGHEFDFHDFLLGRWAERMRRIEQRAYQLFERRGSRHGRALDDWLTAEQDLNADSTCEVDIGDKSVTILLKAPGFAADDMTITALPSLLVVEGIADHEGFGKEDGASSEEQLTRTFFQQIPLPEAADIDKASALFQNGELRITVPLKSAEVKLASRASAP